MATRTPTSPAAATQPGRARTNPTRTNRSDAPAVARKRSAGGRRAESNGRQRERAQRGGERVERSSERESSGGVADKLRSAGTAVGSGISAHPVPMALIGTGLAWLLLETRGSDLRRSALLEHARSRFEEVSEGVSEAVGSALESARDSVIAMPGAVRGGLAGAAETVVDGTRRLGEATQEGARAVGSTLRDGAVAVGDGSRRGYQYTRDAAARTWEEHPLVSGLSLLATGVAIGMMMPPVRGGAGRLADNLTQRIKSAGATLVERGQQVVSSLTPGSQAGDATGADSPPAEKKQQRRRRK